MPVASGHDDGTLSQWLEANGYDEQPAGVEAIADVARVRTLLRIAARAGHAVSYSGMLRDLGHRFTRPKMRALCRTLDAVDRQAALDGEPPLAVLVVREGDRLPGQGWWLGAADAYGYRGPWDGPDATTFVGMQQQRAFDFWAKR